MNFYKKAYRYIAGIIFTIGMLCLPFLKYIINGYEEVKLAVPELNWIYVMFLLNTVITYLMAYKRTLIIADQREYKITPIIMAFNIISTLAQILVLIIFKNFILYLGIQIIVKVFENIFVNRYINKNYDYIKDKNTDKLPKDNVRGLITNVKALMVHKIGEIAVYSTDNLIITKIINIVVTGLYSNYTLITGVFKNLTTMLFNNVTASMGNLIVTENEDKKIQIFNVMNFVAFWVFTVTAVFMFVIIDPFVRLEYGEQYVLPLITTALIIIEYFYYGMRLAVSTVKSAAGIYVQDKYVPLITAIINLVVSIILGKKIGLDGVIIGTIVSTASISLWYRPMLVYKNVFKTSSKQYFVKLLTYTIVFTISLVGTGLLSYYFPINNMYIKFIYCAFIGLIIPNILIFLLYRKTSELKRVIEIIKNTVKRRLKRNEM